MVTRCTVGILGRHDLSDLNSLDQQIPLPSDQINYPDHDPTDLPLDFDYTDWITQNSMLIGAEVMSAR